MGNETGRSGTPLLLGKIWRGDSFDDPAGRQICPGRGTLPAGTNRFLLRNHEEPDDLTTGMKRLEAFCPAPGDWHGTCSAFKAYEKQFYSTSIRLPFRHALMVPAALHTTRGQESRSRQHRRDARLAAPLFGNHARSPPPGPLKSAAGESASPRRAGSRRPSPRPRSNSPRPSPPRPGNKVPAPNRYAANGV